VLKNDKHNKQIKAIEIWYSLPGKTKTPFNLITKKKIDYYIRPSICIGLEILTTRTKIRMKKQKMKM
jgi:hypothetical protein